MQTNADLISVLSHPTSRLAKKWRADGTIENYEDGKYFDLEEVKVSSIAELSSLLLSLERRYNTCVIRGRYKGAVYASQVDQANHKEGKVLRQSEFWQDAPLRALLIDVDNFALEPGETVPAGLNRFIATRLPICFHGVTYHCQLSNTFGHPTKAGQLRAHLWYWLRTPATWEQLRAWDAQLGLKLDTSTFRVVQPLYTACPVMSAGVVDPVGQRSALIRGIIDDVDLDLSGIDVSVYGGQTGGRGRVAQLKHAQHADPVAQFLFDSGFVHGTGARGELFIVCPFDADHSQPSKGEADTSTCYFPAHTQGYALGHFKCLHASCEGKTDTDYKVKSGYLANRFSQWDKLARAEEGEEVAAVSLLPLEISPAGIARMDWEARIGAIENFDILASTVAPDIALDDRLDDLNRELLAKLLQKRFKDVGKGLAIKEVRKLIAPQRSGIQQTDTLDNYRLLVDSDSFYSMVLRCQIGAKVAKAQFLSMRLNKGESSLEDYVLRKIKRVYGARYWPGQLDEFEFDGRVFVNTFEPLSIPPGRVPDGVQDQTKLHYVQEFLQWLCGESYCKFVQYIAYCRRHPGEKILFMPVFYGSYGIGKSTVATIMREVLGHRNCADVKMSSVAEKFNGWAEGGLMGFFEEIKHFVNGVEVGDAIKEVVTNEWIDIRRMNTDNYTTKNTKNYIGMTNNLDAFDLTKMDRRVWVIHCEEPARDADYYRYLTDIIRNEGALICGWLDSVDLGGFDAKGHAPITAARERVAEGARSDLSLAIENIAAEGGEGICEDAFFASSMRAKLLAEGHDLKNGSPIFARACAQAGFVHYGSNGRVKPTSRTEILYIRRGSGLEKLDFREDILPKLNLRPL